MRREVLGKGKVNTFDLEESPVAVPRENRADVSSQEVRRDCGNVRASMEGKAVLGQIVIGFQKGVGRSQVNRKDMSPDNDAFFLECFQLFLALFVPRVIEHTEILEVVEVENRLRQFL